MKRTRPSPAAFSERLAAQAELLKKEAQRLPPGRARDGLLRRVEQIETAVNIDKWLSSPGLQPPVSGTRHA